jgi:hypothetical protein
MAEEKENGFQRHAWFFGFITAVVILAGYLENRKLTKLNKELASLQIQKLKGGLPITEGGAPAPAKLA